MGLFFGNEELSVRFLDAVEVDQGAVNVRNAARGFDALSFRIRSDATLTAEGKEIGVGDDAVCFVPAGLSYERRATVDRLIAVHFTCQPACPGLPEFFYPENPERLRTLFEELLSVWRLAAPGARYRCTGLLYEILAQCAAQTGTPVRRDERIAGAVRFLEEHFSDPEITIRDAAGQSFLSEDYFRRIFREEYGMSPRRYLIELRMRHAVGLMETGYYSLGEVAALSGYADYSYFTSEFKRHFGASPSQYAYRFSL